MGKRKFNIKKNKANRLACNRENDQFDSIEDDNEKNEIGHKNLPRIIELWQRTTAHDRLRAEPPQRTRIALQLHCSVKRRHELLKFETALQHITL